MLAQVTYEQLYARIKENLAADAATNAPSWLAAVPHGALHIAMLSAFGLVGLLFLIGGWYTVSTQKYAVVERFGKFKKIAGPGLHFKIPLIESVDNNWSLQLEQHDVKFTSLTKDKVTVMVVATVQYRVQPTKEYEAYYLLDDPADQIEKFLADVMRSQVPVRTLDELYAVKDEISVSATAELEKDMAQFGYSVPRVLITAIKPDDKVAAAMNDINAAQREATAAAARGDAAKTLAIKEAEGRAEADRLRGVGIAGQRLAIATGFQKSLEELRLAAPMTSDSDLLALLMMAQYLETMEKLADNSDSNVIFANPSPGGVTDLRSQITQALLTAGHAKTS